MCAANHLNPYFSGVPHEAHISAQQPCARSSSRIPLAYCDPRWPQHPARASRPWPQAPERLIGPPPVIAGAHDSTGFEQTGAPDRSGAPVVLRQRSDFLAANGGLRVGTPAFVLLVKPRQDADTTRRIGYTVTKKTGNAVVRNRIKRRFRALVHQVLPGHGLEGADHVLIGRPDALTRDFAAMQADLERALTKVRDGKASADRRPPRGKPRRR
jgi:ribonuclease P protein component